MRLAILVVFILRVGAQDNQARTQFEQFKVDYAKTYNDAAEEEYRFSVFCDNLKRIAEYNSEPADGAEYGITRWADKSDQENRIRCGGSCVGPNCTRVTARRGVRAKSHAWDGTCYAKQRFPELCNSTLPTEIDWTTKGAVTGVKDQGECGNCFTFGATCDMEAAWFLAGNDLLSLSEQQLTSCDKQGGDGGCDGGDTNLDTDEYVTAHGLNSEKNYPYSDATRKKQKSGKCNKNLEASPAAKFSGGYQISGGIQEKGCDWCDKQPVDENVMMKHLATAGPFTIAINSKYFDAYKRGIMNPLFCNSGVNALDHQVAIVGYGTENGKDYWKIKNSWGTDWGEKGFCRIARGTNKCGVAADASHVIAAGHAPSPTPPSPPGPRPPSPPSPTPPSPPSPPSPPAPSPEPTPHGKCTQKCLSTVMKLCPKSLFPTYGLCVACGEARQGVQDDCPTEKIGKDCCDSVHPSVTVV